MAHSSLTLILWKLWNEQSRSKKRRCHSLPLSTQSRLQFPPNLNLRIKVGSQFGTIGPRPALSTMMAPSNCSSIDESELKIQVEYKRACGSSRRAILCLILRWVTTLNPKMVHRNFRTKSWYRKSENLSSFCLQSTGWVMHRFTSLRKATNNSRRIDKNWRNCLRGTKSLRLHSQGCPFKKTRNTVYRWSMEVMKELLDLGSAWTGPNQKVTFCKGMIYIACHHPTRRRL